MPDPTRETISASEVERLLSRAIPEPNSGCYIWLGATTEHGYPLTSNWKGGSRLVHRRIYEFLNGPVAVGMQIDHRCRLTYCINPDHLRAVLPRENCLNSVTANIVKTHCRYGHPYSGDNLIVRKRGSRECRTCISDHAKRKRANARS